jgi:CDP-diacylglycerol---glycerol-3-phosphate 3-phosphatidyltransferase
MTANVGIAERAERLVVVLVATGLVGLGVPELLLTVVLGLLAVASLITVIQRMIEVRRQAVKAA